MPIIARGDIELSYDDVGTGPVLMWIPGTGLRGSTWNLQIEKLRHRYRCISVDLRGSGDSTGGNTAFTVADLAGDVAEVLDQVGVKRATVIGLSLGSAVAQELALARPELVSGLVLLATWSSSTREHHIRRHFESRLYALEHGPLDVYGQFSFWMSSPTLFDNEPALQAEVVKRLAAHTSSTPEGTAGHFRADLGHETRDRLPDIKCPTLVVHGAEDLITLPWYNEAVAAAIPNATRIVLPRAGHLAWLERPAELTAEIELFLTARVEAPAEADH